MTVMLPVRCWIIEETRGESSPSSRLNDPLSFQLENWCYRQRETDRNCSSVTATWHPMADGGLSPAILGDWLPGNGFVWRPQDRASLTHLPLGQRKTVLPCTALQQVSNRAKSFVATEYGNWTVETHSSFPSPSTSSSFRKFSTPIHCRHWCSFSRYSWRHCFPYLVRQIGRV